MDMYLAEVAPDPSLRPARFIELATALPAAARDCHDALYRAIDVYFQVHSPPNSERCLASRHCSWSVRILQQAEDGIRDRVM